MEECKNSVELQLPSRLGCEKVAMDFAAGVAREMGFSDERVEDLKTAVAEACINAIEHGNKLDETLSIGIVMSMDSEMLEVKVVDSGEGVSEPSEAHDIEKKMQEEQHPRGMGMFLIEALMDEVEWGRTSKEGSFARMVIRLKPDNAAEELI